MISGFDSFNSSHLSFGVSCSFLGHPSSCCLLWEGHPSGGVLALWAYFAFAMPLPSSPLSIDIKCGGFPAGTLSSDVAKLLVDYFVVAMEHRIVCVQEFPGKVARVTFDVGGEVYIDRFLHEGEITINGVECSIIRPPPPPSSYTNVVFQFPYDGDNKLLAKELSAYGEVKDVRFQKWTNIPDMSTGTRIVQMRRTRPIPWFLTVQGV